MPRLSYVPRICPDLWYSYVPRLGMHPDHFASCLEYVIMPSYDNLSRKYDCHIVHACLMYVQCVRVCACFQTLIAQCRALLIPHTTINSLTIKDTNSNVLSLNIHVHVCMYDCTHCAGCHGVAPCFCVGGGEVPCQAVGRSQESTRWTAD